MNDNLLVRMIGKDFEVYQFMNDIDEFMEYFKANEDTFQIFEIAKLGDVEITPINKNYDVYDLTLANSGEHLWLVKDLTSDTYEPLDSQEEVNKVREYLQEQDIAQD